MGKKRLISAHSDLKTGFFCKLLLILGVLLLVLYLIEYSLHVLSLNDAAAGTILAFAILCLGVGGIMYFFSCQFTKLSQIAQDVESDESLLDDEPDKQNDIDEK